MTFSNMTNNELAADLRKTLEVAEFWDAKGDCLRSAPFHRRLERIEAELKQRQEQAKTEGVVFPKGRW